MNELPRSVAKEWNGWSEFCLSPGYMTFEVNFGFLGFARNDGRGAAGMIGGWHGTGAINCAPTMRVRHTHRRLSTAKSQGAINCAPTMRVRHTHRRLSTAKSQGAINCAPTMRVRHTHRRLSTAKSQGAINCASTMRVRHTHRRLSTAKSQGAINCASTMTGAPGRGRYDYTGWPGEL